MLKKLATKSRLNELKGSAATAQMGMELMEKKRIILVRELMALIERAKELQKRIDETFATAYASMRIAEIALGAPAESTSESVMVDNDLKFRYRNVMGVELVSVTNERNDLNEPPYGLGGTNGDMDTALFKFREVKRLVTELAETENSIFRLAQSIRQAQKRKNALANIVLPEMQAEMRHITAVLEEHDREDYIRRKLVKGRQSE